MKTDYGKWISTALAFLCLALLPMSAHAGNLEEITGNKQILVGMEIGYFPFEYLDQKGEPVGFDVKLAELLADDLGVKLTIVDSPWDQLIQALNEGRINCIISAMTRTDERSEQVDFSDSYFETGLCLLLNKAKTKGLGSFKDLDQKGRIITAPSKTAAAAEAVILFSSAKVKTVPTETEAVEAVVKGAADAFFMDQLTVWKRHKDHPDETKALLKPMTLEFFAIAVPKGDNEFRDRINLFLTKIKADGRLNKLKKEYLSELVEAAN